MAPLAESKFYDVAEAAPRLGRSPSTIRRWIRDHELFGIQTDDGGEMKIPGYVMNDLLENDQVSSKRSRLDLYIEHRDGFTEHFHKMHPEALGFLVEGKQRR